MINLLTSVVFAFTRLKTYGYIYACTILTVQCNHITWNIDLTKLIKFNDYAPKPEGLSGFYAHQTLESVAGIHSVSYKQKNTQKCLMYIQQKCLMHIQQLHTRSGCGKTIMQAIPPTASSQITLACIPQTRLHAHTTHLWPSTKHSHQSLIVTETQPFKCQHS